MTRALLFATLCSMLAVASGRAQTPEREPGTADLASHNWQTRLRAVEALGRGAPKNVASLTRALGDSHVAVRRAAAYALGPFGADAHVAVPQLIALLRDGARSVREAAAMALGWMRADQKAVVPALVGATRDGWSLVRIAAATSLGEVRADAAQGVPALVALFADKSPFVRDAASRALSWILRDEPRHVALLTKASHATDWRVRVHVCLALEGPAARAAKKLLQRLQRDRYFKVRDAATLALASAAHRW